MLRELRIRDFAIIDDLALSFDAGLNVLTGETGAGKSIILQALGLLSELFPDREVVGRHCLDLVWGLGSIHCSTHQEPSISGE